MRIGLIIIGDELLSGSTQDCNMLYLGEKLQSIGEVLETTTVISDNFERINQTFKQFLNEYDITFCSGGLGPTEDDRTKLALAKFLDTSLEENETAKVLAKRHYENRGLIWNPQLNHYHHIPKDVTPYENPYGLAPGLLYESTNATLLCAPGVPREFTGMVDHFIENNGKFSTKTPIETFTIRTQGIPEEQIFNHRCPNLWDRLSTFGEVSSYPRATGIDIVLLSGNNTPCF